MLYDRAMPPEGRLVRAGSIAEAVAGAAWVQESVPERLEIKHKVLAEIEAAARPDTLIGSSTSGFKPSEIREGATHPPGSSSPTRSTRLPPATRGACGGRCA